MTTSSAWSSTKQCQTVTQRPPVFLGELSNVLSLNLRKGGKSGLRGVCLIACTIMLLFIMRSLYLLIIKHGHLGRGEPLQRGELPP